jgi:hypothetical protein
MAALSMTPLFESIPRLGLPSVGRIADRRRRLPPIGAAGADCPGLQYDGSGLFIVFAWLAFLLTPEWQSTC